MEMAYPCEVNDRFRVVLLIKHEVDEARIRVNTMNLIGKTAILGQFPNSDAGKFLGPVASKSDIFPLSIPNETCLRFEPFGHHFRSHLAGLTCDSC